MSSKDTTKKQIQKMLFENRPENVSLSEYYSYIKEINTSNGPELLRYKETMNTKKNSTLKSPEYYRNRNKRKTKEEYVKNKNTIRETKKIKRQLNDSENKIKLKDSKTNFKDGSIKIDEFELKKKETSHNKKINKNKYIYNKENIKNNSFEKKIKVNEKINSMEYKGMINSKTARTRTIAKNDLARIAGKTELSQLEKTMLNKSKQIKSLSIFKGAGLLVATGAGLTIAKRVLSSEEKNEKNSIEKDFVKTTSLAGLGTYGIVMAGAKASEKNIISEQFKKASGIKNQALNNLNPDTSKAFSKGLETSAIKRSSKLAQNGKKVLGASAIFIGATAIIDKSLQRNYKHSAEKQSKKDEKQLEEQQKRQQKYSRKKSMYYDNNMGQIALDLFDERIGHHKMGNSKY